MQIQGPEFINSLSKYIFAYYVPDITLGAGDAAVNKIHQNSCLHAP